jgi:selenocysteine-specific elongation factor
MKTYRFEAFLALEKKEGILPAQAVLFIQGQKVPASLRILEPAAETRAPRFFVQFSTRRPLSLKWREPFEVLEGKKMEPIGRGVVLNPFLPEKAKFRKDATIDFLLALSGTEKDMLAGLCRERGIKGLREQEIQEFSPLGGEQILRLGEKLEEEGKVKIISFSPIFLISRESFDFLCEKILAFLEQLRQSHPGQRGVALERIRKRFDLAEKVLTLAVKTLERTEKARRVGQKLALYSQEVLLSPQEESILQKLEEMCFRGQFQTVSLGEIRREFRLSADRLERLLSLLVERKKIVPGPEGLYIHAHWLDGIIGKVRALGKKEMTVSEFKALTGLSRKYAIPLLELLDQMRVTQRKGPAREIL